MKLVNSNEAFFYVDQELDQQWYRIFNYRLASYTDFLQPGALECRGVMFEVSEEGKDATPIRLASHPMEKFFNYGENPFTMNVDLSSVTEVEIKADGSLISTFLHNGKLYLKSKGSLFSDQAIDALKWLKQPENHELYNELERCALLEGTVNLEWTAPHNRIVIGYEKPDLIVLNVRDNTNGEYVDYEEVDSYHFPRILEHWTERVEVNDPVSFIESIPDMVGIEGYVVRLASGQRMKIKTTWYLALHHTKDNINSPRRLFEAVLEEATDDMKVMFRDDPVAIQTIEEMEKFVEEKYNHMVDVVERFYQRNKHLERKDYAILGKQELDPMFFGLAMSKYVGRDVNYKDFLKKQWKKLGLKEETIPND